MARLPFRCNCQWMSFWAIFIAMTKRARDDTKKLEMLLTEQLYRYALNVPREKNLNVYTKWYNVDPSVTGPLSRDVFAQFLRDFSQRNVIELACRFEQVRPTHIICAYSALRARLGRDAANMILNAAYRPDYATLLEHIRKAMRVDCSRIDRDYKRARYDFSWGEELLKKL